MRFYGLVLGALAVWRVTHLLVVEDGPWDLLSQWRQRASAGILRGLLNCFYCLSPWIAAPIAMLVAPFADTAWSELLLMWLALSASAILLERVTSREAPSPAVYFEDAEDSEDVLRKEWKESKTLR